MFIQNGADRAQGSEVGAFDVVTYRLTISNRRGGRAEGVVVTDTPPPHMRYVPGSTKVDGARVEDSGGTSPLFSGGVAIGTLNTNQTRSITFQMSVDSGAPAGALLQNRGYVNWNGGSSSAVFNLRVWQPRFGPKLSQTIRVEGPQGRIVFVTAHNLVLNALPETGFPSVVLALLGLSSLGFGGSLSSSIGSDLFRRLQGRPQRDDTGSEGREHS